MAHDSQVVDGALMEASEIEAFVARYRQTAPQVFAYLCRACAGERQRAEDLTQETFSAALLAWNAGRADDVTLPWLLTVARNKMIDDGALQWGKPANGIEQAVVVVLLQTRAGPTDARESFLFNVQLPRRLRTMLEEQRDDD